MPKPRTQRTPKGDEIPVPTRGDFFRNLKKATTPVKKKSERGPKK